MCGGASTSSSGSWSVSGCGVAIADEHPHHPEALLGRVGRDADLAADRRVRAVGDDRDELAVREPVGPPVVRAGDRAGELFLAERERHAAVRAAIVQRADACRRRRGAGRGWSPSTRTATGSWPTSADQPHRVPVVTQSVGGRVVRRPRRPVDPPDGGTAAGRRGYAAARARAHVSIGAVPRSPSPHAVRSADRSRPVASRRGTRPRDLSGRAQRAHAAAVAAGEPGYLDPDTGFFVFTEARAARAGFVLWERLPPLPVRKPSRPVTGRRGVPADVHPLVAQGEEGFGMRRSGSHPLRGAGDSRNRGGPLGPRSDAHRTREGDFRRVAPVGSTVDLPRCTTREPRSGTSGNSDVHCPYETVPTS